MAAHNERASGTRCLSGAVHANYCYSAIREICPLVLVAAIPSEVHVGFARSAPGARAKWIIIGRRSEGNMPLVARAEEEEDTTVHRSELLFGNNDASDRLSAACARYCPLGCQSCGAQLAASAAAAAAAPIMGLVSELLEVWARVEDIEKTAQLHSFPF